MITSIADLASEVEADHETVKSIARRLYKDTKCGVSAHVREGVVSRKSVTYSVRCALTILGWKVLGWRRVGERTNLGTVPLPTGLADYLLTNDSGPSRVPVLCERDYDDNPAHEFGRAWMDELELDDQLLRKTKWARGVVLTVRVDEPVSGTLFEVIGYCEGSDDHIAPQSLVFPFTSEALWEAVEAADKDGCDTWDETHGCEDCGFEFDGRTPVNPDCASCAGAGRIL
jgi:hypothetical protein